MSQSVLEALLVMAYNVGRDHEKTGTFPLDEGRRVTVDALTKFVADIDPGDLAKPLVQMLDVNATINIGKQRHHPKDRW